MSDTISRQAAIRWVKTECNPYGKPTLDFESGKKVIEHLEQMPSAVCDDCIWTVCNYNKVDWDTPSAEAEWIPCSERLPEEHEWVGTKQFGTTISDKVHITFDVNGERFVKTLSLQNGELSNYEKQTMDTLYKGWKMIAWMPLPEPYREDGEA